MAIGDGELERAIVHPAMDEFESDDRDTVRFTATDDDGQDLLPERGTFDRIDGR